MLRIEYEVEKERCKLIDLGSWAAEQYKIEGKLNDVKFKKDPVFGFEVPQTCPNVPDEVLNPSESWNDKKEYDRRYKDLAMRFIQNFAKFADGTPQELKARSELAGAVRLRTRSVGAAALSLRRAGEPAPRRRSAARRRRRPAPTARRRTWSTSSSSATVASTRSTTSACSRTTSRGSSRGERSTTWC